MNINIHPERIIKISDFVRKFKETSKKIEDLGICIIFKNNKPDKVIMTFEHYEKIMKQLRLLELKQMTLAERLINGMEQAIEHEKKRGR